MIRLKTPQEIAILHEGGEILSRILDELLRTAKPGVTTGELEALACRRMAEAGGTPSFKGYRTSGDQRPFPTALCTSLDYEVVHGTALPPRRLKDGQLLKIDVGMRYKGLYTDMAATVPIGTVAQADLELLRATREALMIGIEKAIAGGWVSDIGKAVDKHIRRHGFTTVKAMVGHGVGHAVHEEPQVPNYLDRSFKPVRLAAGMVLALEPMVNFGDDEIGMLPDGWTIVTADGSNSAHFEATIAVTDKGPDILTPIPPFAWTL
ncbi:MAG: type I methionyl aminopeptidase [Patescibacteria group bacterium]|nr:type I methionyl aminopeptidase [Patescibacteria group bacterium]